VIAIVVVAIVVVIAIVGGYAFYNYQRFVSGVTHVQALVPMKTDIDGAAQNILLVGDDHRPAGATAAQLAELGTTQDGGGTNTDTIILLHIPVNGSPTLISFPRDSWVSVPGVGMRKINSAFQIGAAKGNSGDGAKLLVSIIQNMTGLEINHYVRVSMLGFYNVVKALGPVTVCLNNAVKDPYSGIDLPAGTSSLNAQQALAFVRQRHGLPNGDLDREIRQQYFLSREVQQATAAGTLLNPVKLQAVVDAVSSSIETDPDLNIVTLAAEVKNAGHMTSATIPISGTPTIRVGSSRISVVEVNTAAMPGFIGAIIGRTVTAAPVTVTPSDVTVTVLNGGSPAGAATTATTTLKALGFATGKPGNAPTQRSTKIEYAPGNEAAAALVARYLPNATKVPNSSVTGIEIILGTDGATVSSTPTAPSAAAAPSAPASTPAASPTAPPTKAYSASTCID
jgi:LCP family protein required for cell wall assembly